jgi:hypothetical protein
VKWIAVRVARKEPQTSYSNMYIRRSIGTLKIEVYKRSDGPRSTLTSVIVTIQ